MKYLVGLMMIVLFSCKHKTADLSGSVPVKAKDFIAAFDEHKDIQFIADTNLTKFEDTITIGYKAITQFIPDSVFEQWYDEKDFAKHITIHPIGAIHKEHETYLLMNVHYKRKQTDVWVAVFNKKDKYLSAMQLIANNEEDGYVHSVAINNEPTFFVAQEKLDKQKQLLYTKVGWAFTDGKGFIQVLNDGNEDEGKNVVINPIDTLPQKNVWSGNYVDDKKNFISLRDSKKPNEYLFFLHINKDKNCEGELKASMKFSDANTAKYEQQGDPCGLTFSFEGREVTIKENGKCGNRRGMDCNFDYTFTKQKETAKKKKK